VLEDQYRQGLEFKLSGDARRHKGLGFSCSTDPDTDVSRSEPRADGAVVYGPNLPTDLRETDEKLSSDPAGAEKLETNNEARESDGPEIAVERIAGEEKPREEDDVGKSEAACLKKSKLFGFVKGSSD